jgi:hypothetical protein
MRWTRQRFAREGIAGRVERPVSDQQHADERCCCGRRSRVVLTPRRWRQVCGGFIDRTGSDKTISASDGGKQARSPGRARRKPLKPLRAGMPGDPGATVVTTRVHYQLRTRGYGCNGHPAFPTPSMGREINAQLGRFAPRGANACLLFDNLHHPTRRPCESRDPYAVPCHFGRGGRGLLPQRTPVAMGPCFRRDDERVRMRLPIFARSDLSAVAQRAKAEGALQSGLGHIG